MQATHSHSFIMTSNGKVGGMKFEIQIISTNMTVNNCAGA